jgi:hypothetical protein
VETKETKETVLREESKEKARKSWMKLDVKKARKSKMKKTTLEKFSVVAIAEQIGAVGVDSARTVPTFALGSMLDISGKVEKVVKREGLCRLGICAVGFS